jgi:NTE family protein
MPKVDLVLEGGGVKGVGLVGAVDQLMRSGYTVERVAGTSAGSIAGAFLAAGLNAEQLTEAMDCLQYERVPDRGPPGLPVVSEGFSLLRNGGAYEGDYVRDFVFETLKGFGVSTFGDLRWTDAGADLNLLDNQQYKLVVMATDVTRGRLLRLPWDYRLLNLNPDEQIVADAVRASMSIPLFFEPVTIHDGKTGEVTTLVDGGVLSNFPVEIFDRTDGKAPRWPTFGIQILPDLPVGSAQLLPPIAHPALRTLRLFPAGRVLEQVVATAIVGNDQTHLEQPCVGRRTIRVDTAGIGIVEFDASAKKREMVVANGAKSAEQFLRTWDWDHYKKECRGPATTAPE